MLYFRIPAETAQFDNKRLCRTCAEKSNVDQIDGLPTPDLHLLIESKRFDKSDAEFKCPVFATDGSCKSERISFREFYLGSCCEQASKWLTENEKGKKTQKYELITN